MSGEVDKVVCIWAFSFDVYFNFLYASNHLFKILLRREKKMASETGGVKPMAIAGRMVRERERLLGMSNEERAWRKQWLKDLELDHGPRVVPQLERELLNPIRRFYRLPLDKMGEALAPVLGVTPSRYVRFWAGKFAMAFVALYASAYYLKYNQNDWTRKGGWRVITSRTVCNPGDEGFPKLSERSQPSDYASRGFKYDAPI